MKQLPLFPPAAYTIERCGNSKSYRIREVSTGRYAFGVGTLIFVPAGERYHNSYPKLAALQEIEKLEKNEYVYQYQRQVD